MTAVDLHHLPDAEPLSRPELPEISLDWRLSDPDHIGRTPHFEIKPSSEEKESTDG